MEVSMLRNLLRALHHFSLFFVAHIKNAIALKTAFYLEVVGMMLNNTAFVIIWIFFFSSVGTINGWGSTEAIGLNALVAIAYGVSFGFAGGASTLAQQVNSGNFDNFLISPVSLYVRVLSSRSQISAFGDIIYGVILFVVYAYLTQLSFLSLALLVLSIPLGALIMINFVLITSLVAFLIPDTVAVASNIFELLISPSLYPSGLYSRGMKFFFTFIIPAITIAGLPIELIANPNLSTFVTLLVLSAFWFFLAKFLLKKAVLKYESGNLIGYKG